MCEQAGLLNGGVDFYCGGLPIWGGHHRGQLSAGAAASIRSAKCEYGVQMTPCYNTYLSYERRFAGMREESAKPGTERGVTNPCAWFGEDRRI